MYNICFSKEMYCKKNFVSNKFCEYHFQMNISYPKFFLHTQTEIIIFPHSMQRESVKKLKTKFYRNDVDNQ